MNLEPKECKYGCGKVIVWRGKDFDKPKSTGFFETDTGEEHTYRRCENIIRNKKEPDPYQTKLF